MRTTGNAAGLSDARIYERHADELIRFATGIVGASEAADVLSTAMVNALSSRSWPHVIEKRAYLYRCVLNAARSSQRSGSRRRVRELRVVYREVANAPETAPEVWEAVKGLSPRQRAVVFLTYWEDLDVSAVAHLLDLSEGTVKQHLARARAHLRRKLDD
ncbi:MAG: sigma-70 family RNA polymerase sigma factor [Acidimicrobiales bacterium]